MNKRALLLIPLLVSVPLILSQVSKDSQVVDRQEVNKNSAISESLAETPSVKTSSTTNEKSNQSSAVSVSSQPLTLSNTVVQQAAPNTTGSSTFNPEVSHSELVLVPELNYSDTIDFTNHTDSAGLSNVEAVSYKSNVLEVKQVPNFSSNSRIVFAIKLLKKPVTADGSMEVVFTAKDYRGNTKNIQVIVRWNSFKYVISVEKPQITAWYGTYMTPNISITNVPNGDNPTVTYTITTDLPFNNGKPLTSSFTTNQPVFIPMYLLDRSPDKGKEYTYTVHVTAVGMSYYEHTFVIKFVY